MAILVERDRSLVSMFQSVLGEGTTTVASIEQVHRHLDEERSEYAVVLGPSVDSTAAATLADEMRIRRPPLSVILVRRRIDTAVLTEALHAGIREVVEDRDLSGLGAAVHRAFGLWQAMTASGDQPVHVRRGQVFTVFGTKGGVGKSTLATNLSAALADGGRIKVCLVDLDIHSGDVAIMLQLSPTSTLADAGTLEHGLDPASIESLMTRHSEGLSVLAAPIQPHAADQLSAEMVGRVLQLLVTMYDVVVVDTAGRFDDFALQAFDHSDVVLLMGTLDMPALKGLKLAVETFDLLNLPRAKWRLVLNRADSKVGLSTDEVEKTLKVKIATAIPSSREVPACINRGDVIVRAQPRHPVSQTIRQLAGQLVAIDGVEVHASPAHSAPEHRRSLFRRKVRSS
jgi:pilus assembly protein CpaE